MSKTSKGDLPPYEVKIAETKDEREACFDLRVEGKRVDALC